MVERGPISAQRTGCSVWDATAQQTVGLLLSQMGAALRIYWDTSHSNKAARRHRLSQLAMMGGEMFLRSGGTAPGNGVGAGHRLQQQGPTTAEPALGTRVIIGLLCLQQRMKILRRAPQVLNRRH